MRIEIVTEKQNPMLKRKEVQFRVDHAETGATPPRLEIRRAVASALKADVEVVFIRKFETKTGTSMAFGVANVYDSVEQAKSVEPEYIVKRNLPPAEKPKEEAPKEEKPKAEVKG
jgi:small subunit ribosomal protein S24e